GRLLAGELLGGRFLGRGPRRGAGRRRLARRRRSFVLAVLVVAVLAVRLGGLRARLRRGLVGLRRLARRLLLGLLLRDRAALAAIVQCLLRARVLDGLDRIALGERGVGLAVGHVVAEAPLAQRDLAAGELVLAERLDRFGGLAAATRLGLRQEHQRLLHSDGEDVLCLLEAVA